MENINAEERLKKYLTSINKAKKKYNETHRDLVNERCRKYYHSQLANSDAYKEKKRQYAKAYYYKKKALQNPVLETQVI
jgi:hypothetical protein